MTYISDLHGLWGTPYSVSTRWQALTLLQPSVVIGRSPFGKHSRSPLISLAEFAMLKSSYQLQSMCITYMVHLNTQPTTMQDCNCLVRPIREALQLHAMPANCIWQHSGQDFSIYQMPARNLSNASSNQTGRQSYIMLQEEHAVPCSIWMWCIRWVAANHLDIMYLYTLSLAVP